MQSRVLSLLVALTWFSNSGCELTKDNSGTSPTVISPCCVKVTVKTGTHWADPSEFLTLKRLGYDFAVIIVDPNYPETWKHALDSAQTAGIKLIIGAWPSPYTYDRLAQSWTISSAGVDFLMYLKSRADQVLAVFGFNEPYYDPGTGPPNPCGSYSAADMRKFRAVIRSIWPEAKVFHDIGAPSDWTSSGPYGQSTPCVGNKYDDQTEVADYVGVWYYPFNAKGYERDAGIAWLRRELSYVTDSMKAIPVMDMQSFLCRHCGVATAWPTANQIHDWNCTVRSHLPAGSSMSWYVWRQDIYNDYLSNHPDMWKLTTAAACR